MFRTLDISASGMIAQRLRVDTIAGNIAQAQTTQNENGEHVPFQRRMVILQTERAASTQQPGGVGVRAEVEIDSATPPRMVYEPGHPHADERGYVSYPNVNVITEFVNAMEASRAYEANITAMQMTKDMIDGTFKLLG